MISIRTDMAVERLVSPVGYGIRTKSETDKKGVTITHVEILDSEGEKTIGKPKGTYITIDAPNLCQHDGDYVLHVTKLLAKEITALCPKFDHTQTALIVGLGNSAITADALGPMTISSVTVSRHITGFLPEQVDQTLRSVCCIAPGVLGVTGLETGEVISGIVEKVSPDIIFAIDSLASGSTSRLGTSIQIANSGIRPGGGLGNRRMELTKETLGVPVIALGIPTVVFASTILRDAVDLLMEKTGEASTTLSELASSLFEEKYGALVVTPKDVDFMLERGSRLLANALDMSLHGITLTTVKSYLQ